MSTGVYPTVDVGRGAQLSDDGRYRYRLTRRWGGGPTATFVMLNPSTADADLDDPTIRRCVGFAIAAGCDALHVVNLFAYRATKPTALSIVDDPVGELNDAILERAAIAAAQNGEPLVAAWGAAPVAVDRAEEVRRIVGMDKLSCLGVTKAGAPRHPLYVPASALLTPWPVP